MSSLVISSERRRIRGIDGHRLEAARRRIERALHDAGLFRLSTAVRPAHLTVLAYHRVVDVDGPDFRDLIENVSATPEIFAQQLEYLNRNYSLISLAQLLDHIRTGADLPSCPALITFDDGYRDNFDHAWPLLHARKLPAVLFLATGCVGARQPFFWDLAAACFGATERREAVLPFLGHRRWRSVAERRKVLRAWLAAAKRQPADAARSAAEDLGEILAVTLPDDWWARQHLDWDMVDQLAAAGVAIGAHTVNHSILSRVDPEIAQREIIESQAAIAARLGEPVRAFAYPNGRPGDYDDGHLRQLQDAGFEAAFSLSPGPMPVAAVRDRPLAIRRVMVELTDDLPRFASKLTGFAPLVGRLRSRLPA